MHIFHFIIELPDGTRHPLSVKLNAEMLPSVRRAFQAALHVAKNIAPGVIVHQRA